MYPKKKPGRSRAFASGKRTRYFASFWAFASFLAFFLAAFFSPLAAFLSDGLAASVDFAGSAGFGWAYAPAVNADATSTMSSFFNMGSPVLLMIPYGSTNQETRGPAPG